MFVKQNILVFKARVGSETTQSETQQERTKLFIGKNQ